MRHDPTEVKLGLQYIANNAADDVAATNWRARRYREFAMDAMAYIRHLEGELRRQGFTEYNEKEDNND
jgi:uncharacterized protein YaiI (UPF0178 family)